MARTFAELAFTQNVKRMQEKMGSRMSYARREARAAQGNLPHTLGPREEAFIAQRDSFYLATVSETGWPYVQHRGGLAGFLRVIDDKSIGFADLSGNRQYVSVGNLASDDRVSLFLMDYPNRVRLKLLGRARVIGQDDAKTLDRLTMPEHRSVVERGVVIRIEAFDWNCPQYITQRFTLDEMDAATAPLRQRIAQLEAAMAAQSERAGRWAS
jgi:predicted pyridoxine 5'-phosphate oxidase superfamily flavin-nucleotide-binding protein